MITELQHLIKRTDWSSEACDKEIAGDLKALAEGAAEANERWSQGDRTPGYNSPSRFVHLAANLTALFARREHLAALKKDLAAVSREVR